MKTRLDRIKFFNYAQLSFLVVFVGALVASLIDQTRPWQILYMIIALACGTGIGRSGVLLRRHRAALRRTSEKKLESAG